MNKKLQMVFKNQNNSNVTLTLDDPKDDLTALEVKTSMQDIVDRNIFKSRTGDIVSILAARIVSTQVEELEVE